MLLENKGVRVIPCHWKTRGHVLSLSDVVFCSSTRMHVGCSTALTNRLHGFEDDKKLLFLARFSNNIQTFGHTCASPVDIPVHKKTSAIGLRQSDVAAKRGVLS